MGERKKKMEIKAEIEKNDPEKKLDCDHVKVEIFGELKITIDQKITKHNFHLVHKTAHISAEEIKEDLLKSISNKHLKKKNIEAKKKVDKNVNLIEMKNKKLVNKLTNITALYSKIIDNLIRLARAQKKDLIRHKRAILGFQIIIIFNLIVHFPGWNYLSSGRQNNQTTITLLDSSFINKTGM